MNTDATAYAAVIERLVHEARRAGPNIVGLCGPQGSGKSTLAQLLQEQLLLRGVQAAVLSLDDFYLTRAERAELGRRVHPLLCTRGVPGTHDIALATRVLDALGRSGTVAVPRFDKAKDDRCPSSEWHVVTAPV